MHKLINYLKVGKGRGLKAMLIFSTVIAVLLWGVVYVSIKKIPDNTKLNQFIDQLPTIVIQEGNVIEPSNVNTTYSIDQTPVFYLQTDRERVSPFSADGIYLTRKMFAFVSEGQIQQGTFLSGNLTVTPDRIKSIIRSFAIWIPIILGIFYFIILWLFYLVVVGISSLLTLILGLMLKFKLNKGAIWRSAAFSTIVILLIDIVMSMFGYSIGRTSYPMIVQLIITLLLTLLINFGIREKRNKTTKE